MKLFSRKDPVQAELEKLKKQEEKFLAKNREQKELPLNRFLQDKIPEKLQGTLEAAFAKAFSLIFEKGTGIIEKTYQKEELEKRSAIRQYAADVRGDRKSLKNFSRQAAGTGAGNTLASAAAGVGMGLLGIGIPDILSLIHISAITMPHPADAVGTMVPAAALPARWPGTSANTSVWRLTT